jgi:hypothetical protein
MRERSSSHIPTLVILGPGSGVSLGVVPDTYSLIQTPHDRTCQITSRLSFQSNFQDFDRHFFVLTTK